MSIKVLVISSYQDNYNAVRPEGELLIGLHRAGVEVTVMTQGNARFCERFRESGVRVIDFHPRRKLEWGAVRRIRRELKEGAYHILHLFNNKAILNGIIAAWDLPVKVVTYRGYTGNVHWYDPSCYLTHLNPRVDKITCLAPSIEELFRRQLFFRKDKAVTVSKGHDPAWYAGIQPALLQDFPLPDDAVVVTLVANARRMKGIPYFIEATFHLPPDLPVCFLLIGRGLDTPAVKKRIKRSPYRDQIHFTGFRKDVLELVKAGDISVSSSIFGEATQKAVLEAMFLGKPVVMTSIPGNRGMAVHGESGLVVPPRDGKALGEAIGKLVQNPRMREEMGRQGQAFIRSRFSVGRSVQEMKAVYESIIV